MLESRTNLVRGSGTDRTFVPTNVCRRLCEMKEMGWCL